MFIVIIIIIIIIIVIIITIIILISPLCCLEKARAVCGCGGSSTSSSDVRPLARSCLRNCRCRIALIPCVVVEPLSLSND